MLSIQRDESTLEVEETLADLKIFVMEEEYSRMEKQLSQVEKKNIFDHLRFFGYSDICFEGDGELINLLRKKAGSMGQEATGEAVLCITEYIDTRSTDRKTSGCCLGIRQFLYELEVFATFPDEITACLQNEQRFALFAERFVDIFQKTGWKIVFSERTPFVDKLQEKKTEVCYLHDLGKGQKAGSKLILIENGNLAEVFAFYHEYKSSCWIVVRRFIILFRTWIMERSDFLFSRGIGEKGSGVICGKLELGIESSFISDRNHHFGTNGKERGI